MVYHEQSQRTSQRADAKKIPLTELELTILPFGKHKDRTFDQIDLKYLDWLLSVEWFNKKFPDLYNKLVQYLKYPTIERELNKELEEQDG